MPKRRLTLRTTNQDVVLREILDQQRRTHEAILRLHDQRTIAASDIIRLRDILTRLVDQVVKLIDQFPRVQLVQARQTKKATRKVG